MSKGFAFGFLDLGGVVLFIITALVLKIPAPA